jgi:hypothetical protein
VQARGRDYAISRIPEVDPYRFVRSGVAVGNIHVNREVDNGAGTGRSGYDKSWASGYLAAMTTVDRFVSDTISGSVDPVVDDAEAGSDVSLVRASGNLLSQHQSLAEPY